LILNGVFVSVGLLFSMIKNIYELSHYTSIKTADLALHTSVHSLLRIAKIEISPLSENLAPFKIHFMEDERTPVMVLHKISPFFFLVYLCNRGNKVTSACAPSTRNTYSSLVGCDAMWSCSFYQHFRGMYQQEVSQDWDVRCLNRQRRANENDRKRKTGKLA
jgi:hypothetical protein